MAGFEGGNFKRVVDTKPDVVVVMGEGDVIASVVSFVIVIALVDVRGDVVVDAVVVVLFCAEVTEDLPAGDIMDDSVTDEDDVVECTKPDDWEDVAEVVVVDGTGVLTLMLLFSVVVRYGTTEDASETAGEDMDAIVLTTVSVFGGYD